MLNSEKERSLLSKANSEFEAKEQNLLEQNEVLKTEASALEGRINQLAHEFQDQLIQTEEAHRVELERVLRENVFVLDIRWNCICCRSIHE